VIGNPALIIVKTKHMRAEELYLLIVENIAQDHQNRRIA